MKSLRKKSITTLQFLLLYIACIDLLNAKYKNAFSFEDLELIDSVVCASDVSHEFLEYPKGISSIEMIYGKPMRILPNKTGSMKYFAYRLGVGKGLQADEAYVLRIVYPEDKPRSIFVVNRGCETMRGFHTGNTTGDGMRVPYVSTNPESLELPLSGDCENWSMLFYLQEQYPGLKAPRLYDQPRDNKPKDGFLVMLLQFSPENDPMSAGVAIERIELYKAPAQEQLVQSIPELPSDLPKRHLFWREEMSDGVISTSNPLNRGYKDDVTWIEQKFRLMDFLGMHTYAKDLLEFGHNQGWDSSKFGGDSWVKQPHNPELWSRIVKRCGEHHFDIIPYFEYAGSKGESAKSLGFKRRARPLNIYPDYTQITWVEEGNVDITDPDTFEDFRKMLEITVVDESKLASFAAVWLRTRVSDIPVSFADATLNRFEQASGRINITRSSLNDDKALYEIYINWWYEQRRQFLLRIHKYLKEHVDQKICLLYTADSTEAGKPLLSTFNAEIIAENPADWTQHPEYQVGSLADALDGNWQLKTLTSDTETYNGWEWQHSVPQSDPSRYADTHGIYITQTVNRAYTLDKEAFDAFRGVDGLAAIRFYALNEDATTVDSDNRLVGYFVADADYAGPFVMLPEALSFAYGDPRFFGYLTSNNFNRGNPYYVRRFNANFLALPALPCKVEKEMCSDPEIVVRSIETSDNGTYLGIVHTGRRSKSVTILFPKKGRLYELVSGDEMNLVEPKLELTLDPCELRSFQYFPEDTDLSAPNE